jgi:hypothetical protein
MVVVMLLAAVIAAAAYGGVACKRPSAFAESPSLATYIVPVPARDVTESITAIRQLRVS